MIKLWKDYINSILFASREIRLDESISICHSRYTCSELILCPWKTYQFENEFHTACCELSGIFVVVDSVEGMANTHQDGSLEFEDLGGKTVVLLLHVMKSYFSTGMYVILDFGFCVLKGLIGLINKDVFSCVVIKR